MKNNIYFNMGAKVLKGRVLQISSTDNRIWKKVLIVSGKHFIFRSGLFEKSRRSFKKI